MRFGFFDQLPCAPGFTEQQRYRDILGRDTVRLPNIEMPPA
jgi:hypothetical protein